MSSRVIYKLLVATLSAITLNAAASGANHFTDQNLDQFMVELSTHKDAGRTALRDRIAEIEQQEGKFSPRLYGYVAELARLKHANGEHQAAIELYQRMQTLTHWSDGVNSPLQMEALRLQSRSLVAQGEMVAADKLERFHLRVAEKNYQGEALMPSLWRLSVWQRMTLQYRKAIKNYNRALDIIAADQLHESYAVRTLEEKALTEHLARIGDPTESLQVALQGRMDNDFSDQMATAAAMLNLADLRVLRGRGEAEQLYAQLHNVPAALLGPVSKDAYIKAFDSVDNPGVAALRSEVWYPEQTQTVSFSSEPEPTNEAATIGAPVRLCTSQVDSEGYADVSIDLSAEGALENLVITGSAPRKTKKYLRAVLLKSRYRPEFVDGEAVGKTLAFRQYFDRSQPIRSDQVAGWRDLLAEHACQLMAMR